MKNYCKRYTVKWLEVELEKLEKTYEVFLANPRTNKKGRFGKFEEGFFKRFESSYSLNYCVAVEMEIRGRKLQIENIKEYERIKADPTADKTYFFDPEE